MLIIFFVYEEQDKTSKQECQANVIYLYDDKKCQSNKSIHMWPLQSAMKSSHMWSVEPAMLQSTYKKFSQVSLFEGRNC